MAPETLELFDITPVTTPPRSKLIAVPPLGMGTSMVEALASLFSRTAQKHVVSPTMLFNRVVLPLTKIKLKRYSANFYSAHSGTMNGYLKYARETVAALEILTKRQGLDRLTLLPWAPILNRTGAKVLRHHPAFCPHCLEEWRQKGGEIYYPLAWYMQAVQLCPVHSSPLAEHCPHCDCRQSIIGRHGILGHCTHCGFWLATSTTAAPHENSGKYMPDAQPMGDHYAALEMLTMSSTENFSVSRSDFIDRIKAHIDVVCQGKVRTFEKRFGFKKNVVTGWLEDGNNPRLDLFLALCHRLNRTPSEFLLGSIPDDLCSQPAESFELISIHRKKKTERELKAIEEELTSMLESDPPITQMEAAKRLGVTRRVLNYRFPTLATQIAQRYRARAHANSIAKLEHKRQTTRRVTQDLMANPRSISRRKIGAALKREGVSIADPEVRREAWQVIKDHSRSKN